MRRRYLGLGLSTVGLIAAFCTAKAPNGAIEDSSQPAAPSVKPVWDEPIEIATGPAYIGPWRTNDSEFHYVDDPTVAVGDAGLISVAWVDQTRRDVIFQVFDRTGAPLAAPVNVSRDANVAAIRDAGDAGGAIDVQPDVVVPTQRPLSGVETHADPYRCVIGPRVRGDRSLRGDGCGNSLGCGGKDDEERITFGSELDTTVRFECLT